MPKPHFWTRDDGAAEAFAVERFRRQCERDAQFRAQLRVTEAEAAELYGLDYTSYGESEQAYHGSDRR